MDQGGSAPKDGEGEPEKVSRCLSPSRGRAAFMLLVTPSLCARDSSRSDGWGAAGAPFRGVLVCHSK